MTDGDGRPRAFTGGSSVGVHQLLTALARAVPNGARVGEAGTGHGAGTAALLAGLPGRSTVVSVDSDPSHIEAARAVVGFDPRVTLLTGDLTVLAEHAPFDLVFHDAGPKPDPDWLLALLAPGGIAVIDDFEPSADPARPLYEGRPDPVRLAYAAHPGLGYREERVSPTEAAVLLTRVWTTSSGWPGRSPRR